MGKPVRLDAPSLRPARALPAASPAASAIHHPRGISLKPSDAVDPYALKRFAPSQAGLSSLSCACPRCDFALHMTDVAIVPSRSLIYIEGVCYDCGPDWQHSKGIYKRLVIPARVMEESEFQVDDVGGV